MPTSFKLLAALALLGVAQALLLASVLLSIKRGNQTANRLLAAFVIVIAIGLGGATLASGPFILIYPHLLKVQDPFFLIGAPLLFLYIRTLITRRAWSGKKDLLHFIPFGLSLLFLLPFYFQSSEAKVFSVGSYFPFWQRWSYIKSTTLLVQFVVYLSLVARMLAAYTRRLKPESSPADKAVLFQVRFMLATLTAIWVIGSLKFVLTLLYPAYDTATVDMIVPASLSLFVYAMGYIGLRKPEVVTGRDNLPPPAKRYEKSTLTIERGDAYLRRLLDLMEKERPYTDGDLTLQKLAKALAMPPNHLSQIINEQLNQNFFDFINLHRIEEAQRMLLDPARKHYSILAISEEVGFNSKSAFNAAFKKHTDMTPSEFRKDIAANGSI